MLTAVSEVKRAGQKDVGGQQIEKERWNSRSGPIESVLVGKKVHLLLPLHKSSKRKK